MSRYNISDKDWEQISPYLQRKTISKAGRPSQIDDRTMFNATLWILHTGAPWRDLPTRFGAWQTAYKRFNTWAKSGVFE